MTRRLLISTIIRAKAFKLALIVAIGFVVKSITDFGYRVIIIILTIVVVTIKIIAINFIIINYYVSFKLNIENFTKLISLILHSV